MAPNNSKKPADEPEQPEVPAVDGGEQAPEPTRDEAEEARLLRELEGGDAADKVPAKVKNAGTSPRRVGYATVAPGATHTITDQERESPRLMAKVRHAIRTGFLTAAE